MYESDLKHPAPALERKLRALYDLRAPKALDLGFRPEYLDLLAALGDPHKRLPPTIHVAGTNGKGSTIATLRALFEAQGYKAHVYTSPHLTRFNERIILAGREIEDGPLEALIDEALEKNAGAELSFFEITTAIAFKAFAETPADILLLETGLGGRLDCTNVIERPAATIITALGLDHQEYLGPTIENIAFEKAGIIKPECPCIVAKQSHQETIKVIKTHAQEVGAPLYVSGKDWTCTRINTDQMRFDHDPVHEPLPVPNLIGEHQIDNAGSALMALWLLRSDFSWSVDKIRNALTRIAWKGRFERIQSPESAAPDSNHLELWYDGGHNENAAIAIKHQLGFWETHDPKDHHIILGMKGDKDAYGFLKHIAPHAKTITLIPIDGVGDCLNMEQVKATLTALGLNLPIAQAPNVQTALKTIPKKTPARVLVCGSLYLAKQLP